MSTGSGVDSHKQVEWVNLLLTNWRNLSGHFWANGCSSFLVCGRDAALWPCSALDTGCHLIHCLWARSLLLKMRQLKWLLRCLWLTHHCCLYLIRALVMLMHERRYRIGRRLLCRRHILRLRCLAHQLLSLLLLLVCSVYLQIIACGWRTMVWSLLAGAHHRHRLLALWPRHVLEKIASVVHLTLL